MTNKEIAYHFGLLAKLMDLHDENSFKVKTYLNANNNIRRLPDALSDMSATDRLALPAIGKSVGAKIDELLTRGSMSALDDLINKTPSGILDIIQIRGLGPKKVKLIWREMGIESATELLYACTENRLIEVKGFGLKSQKDIAQRIEYFLNSRSKYLYARVIDQLDELIDRLDVIDPGRFYWMGDVALKKPVINEVAILYSGSLSFSDLVMPPDILIDEIQDSKIYIRYKDSLKAAVIINQEKPTKIYFEESLSPELLANKTEIIQANVDKSIEEVVLKTELNAIPVECWDWTDGWTNLTQNLIRQEDILGVVHAHSTYSDGQHTLKKMAQESKNKGYQYLVISDHSKAAFYANGLTEEDVIRQSEEIDQLNTSMSDFKVYKGIECDILSDGSMDYSSDFLKEFDVVIASIHSNLKMTIDKSMNRLIKAIENPNTHILGHLTGRLLLAREGYPVDHMKIIDACAANNMAIELNANPYRLDIDYTWIDYAQNKGVLISINPDAHSVDGIDDIKYGLLAARKGRLQRENCLNARSAEAFIDLL